MLARAFDKAVRRKPLALAADAGLWSLNGGEVEECRYMARASVNPHEPKAGCEAAEAALWRLLECEN